MRISIECYPCLIDQAVRLARTKVESIPEQKRLLQKIMGEIANSDVNDSAPYVAHKIQRIFKQHLQDPDPYREEKNYYNTEMLKLESCLSDLIISADDRLLAALKLAAAGNVIDFGPGHELSPEKVVAVIHETLTQDISPGVWATLQSKLGSSQTLLYLGDNCGEIVLDKLFIRTIKEYCPGLDVYFAVRGGAALNDVTREDADMVGMRAYAKIIDSGIDIQGIELPLCSLEFRDCFHAADVIIAKGQGNFESLYGCGRDNLFYLFLCKCNLFMERCGARHNELILMTDRSEFVAE